MTADDLPWDVKQSLLAQVRAQLGEYEFNRLVGAFGEDGVLNLVLDRMRQATAAPGRSLRPRATEVSAAARRWADRILSVFHAVAVTAWAAALVGVCYGAHLLAQQKISEQAGSVVGLLALFGGLPVALAAGSGPWQARLAALGGFVIWFPGGTALSAACYSVNATAGHCVFGTMFVVPLVIFYILWAWPR